MLIHESFIDVPVPAAPPGLSSHDSGSSATTTGGSSNTIRIHLFYPALIREYPQAKFPAVAVFTEIYQVTGPVQRFCRQIAANGYIVGCPESYHEFEAPGVVIPYDVEGTDRGNRYKMEKLLTAYDQDATLVLDALAAHPNCNGRLGATGMCLGGHLAFRCAFDRRVLASVCYFATDIHGSTLGKNNDPNNTSLARCKEIKGEVVMIWGKHDNHIPQHGRQLIYQTLASAGADFGWVELPAQHAFIRDELSKGRYDPPLAKICFEVLLELFHRKLDLDLGAAAVAAAGQSNAGAQQQQPLVC